MNCFKKFMKVHGCRFCVDALLLSHFEQQMFNFIHKFSLVFHLCKGKDKNQAADGNLGYVRNNDRPQLFCCYPDWTTTHRQDLLLWVSLSSSHFVHIRRVLCILFGAVTCLCKQKQEIKLRFCKISAHVQNFLHVKSYTCVFCRGFLETSGKGNITVGKGNWVTFVLKNRPFL